MTLIVPQSAKAECLRVHFATACYVPESGTVLGRTVIHDSALCANEAVNLKDGPLVSNPGDK